LSSWERSEAEYRVVFPTSSSYFLMYPEKRRYGFYLKISQNTMRS
jgi:hypothetical protein